MLTVLALSFVLMAGATATVDTYLEKAIERGVPLFNQSKWLLPDQTRKACIEPLHTERPGTGSNALT